MTDLQSKLDSRAETGCTLRKLHLKSETFMPIVKFDLFANLIYNNLYSSP